MVKRRTAAERVYTLFKALAEDHQDDFLHLCLSDDANNAIKSIVERESFEAFDGQIAKVDLIHKEMELERRTRKPIEKLAAEIIHLREVETLTFGQIAKRLKLKNEATARQRYNRAKLRQKQESLRAEIEAKATDLRLIDDKDPDYRRVSAELKAKVAEFRSL